MLSKKVLAELNEQIKHEFYSAYYYLALAAWCDQNNLTGSSHFFRLQSQEEWGHGMKFFDYVLERNGDVRLEALEEPKSDFASLLDCFKHALEHERFVTRRIYDLMSLAQSEKDYATVNMLHWFVDEQVEEESSMERILERIRIAGESGSGLLLIDGELSRRTAAE